MRWGHGPVQDSLSGYQITKMEYHTNFSLEFGEWRMSLLPGTVVAQLATAYGSAASRLRQAVGPGC